MMQTIESKMEYINGILQQKYNSLIINETMCFLLPSGIVVRVDAFENNGTAFVVEYADNLNEARINRFEDGDLFYPSDYDSDKAFANDLLKEIENV